MAIADALPHRQAVARARRFVARTGGNTVSRTIWGSADRARARWAAFAGLLAVCLLVSGCTSSSRPAAGDASVRFVAAPWDNSSLAFPERLEQGYTIVLPGIWGSQPLDHGIVKGLIDANVPTTIELYDWTEGPMMLLYNLRAMAHNRIEGTKVAAKIVAYQNRYPGRPVNLIGYSGGAGVAVLALESLPPGRKVATTILLAPALAPDYDLRTAMAHTAGPLHTFYSPVDAPILMVLTTAAGTMEGRHTLAAGAVGFTVPGVVAENQRAAYSSRVDQQPYSLDMLATGHPGGHFGWTSRAFVAKWLAPLVASSASAPIQTAAQPDTGLVR
jgi:pimeloyl-ACP methyl ester carboxylesterase